MNKAKIDELIPTAYDVLQESEIAINNKVNKAYQGQIASLGAAIAMGSLLSATAYFMNKGQAKVDRTKLLKAIFELIKEDEKNKGITIEESNLFSYIKNHGNDKQLKDKVLDSLTAIKLAMNLFELEENNG